MGYHIVRDSNDHIEILNEKEYNQRRTGKGCLMALLLAVIIGYALCHQGDEKPVKTQTEVVSEKSLSVESMTEQTDKSQVAVEDNIQSTTYENVEEETETGLKEEEKAETNEEENLGEEISLF